MKKNQIVYSIIVAILGYIGIYLYLRNSDHLIRYENKGTEIGQIIVAKRSEWADLANEMSEDSETLADDLIVTSEKIIKGSINIVFYPFRKIEELWWNTNN